ncbi:MazG-like family protein [Catellatospora sp. NPDC049111]|uniref:MazG-like family protein n=1 Tax=Catellatospora sp. NPDC049111 TaxID=3155271 RepID=UPI003411D353
MDETTRRAVDAAVGWLDAHHGSGPQQQTMRILKVTEEAGEAASAWIGVQGQNPRKGVTHAPREVADELADVALASFVAIRSLGFDPAEVLSAKAGKVLDRMAAHQRLTAQRRPGPDAG